MRIAIAIMIVLLGAPAWADPIPLYFSTPIAKPYRELGPIRVNVVRKSDSSITHKYRSDEIAEKDIDMTATYQSLIDQMREKARGMRADAVIKVRPIRSCQCGVAKVGTVDVVFDVASVLMGDGTMPPEAAVKDVVGLEGIAVSKR